MLRVNQLVGLGVVRGASFPVGDNFIPAMTSNTAPSGVASASSFLGGYDPWQAFSATNTDSWLSDFGQVTNQWLEYQFATSQVVNQYAITTHMTGSAQAGHPQRSPNTFNFEAWNGSAWVNLHSASGITWSVDQRRVYTFTNTTSYTRYRLFMSTSNDGNYVGLGRLEMGFQ